jgi:Peptidase family M28/PDZ domain
VRTSNLLRLLAVTLVLANCAPELPKSAPLAPTPSVTPPAPPPPPVALTVNDEPAAADRIAADVRLLASPELAGRGTGDPGAKLAADFIAIRFTELKLTPLGDKGEGAVSYLQGFQARVGAKVEPASVSAAAPKGAKTAPPAALAVVANGSADGEAKGKVVFVGYGITAPAVGWDDYAGAEVEGAIVVVLDGVPPAPDVKPQHPAADPHVQEHAAHRGEAAAQPGPANPLRDFGSVRYKLRTAREHKAAGVVVVTSAELPPPPSDASSMGLVGVVMTRAAADASFPGLGLAQKAVWEAKKPARARALKSPTEVTVASHIKPKDAEAWNVVAMLPARDGSKTAAEYVVVGAHYDHLGHGGSPSSLAPGVIAVHPGADDNASGSALMLDVARRLSALPRRPARNVIFIAFGAEELGTLGSHHWVEHAPVPVSAITAMINADMVGRLRDGRLIVEGTGTSARWPELARAASSGLSLDLALGTEGFGASDHTSFTAARVPVAFLFTGVHDDYHRPSDTADKINAAGEERVATLAARLALAVTEADERLAFVDPPRDPNKTGTRAFKVSLGTVPDYAYAGKGVRLTGVRPDAPAMRAGLKAGDVIVKIGEHEVTNMHDYMFSFGDLEPGREVVVEVERDGTRVARKLVPAPGR